MAAFDAAACKCYTSDYSMAEKNRLNDGPNVSADQDGPSWHSLVSFVTMPSRGMSGRDDVCLGARGRDVYLIPRAALSIAAVISSILLRRHSWRTWWTSAAVQDPAD